MAATKKPAKISPPQTTPDPHPMLFPTKEDWRAWLDQNHRASSGLWMQIAKKGAASQSVTYKEALDIALCYGWIDGQKKPESDQLWLQRFLPRAARSIWSKINREKALSLIASGEMKSAGLEAIEQAKHAGRWDTAYDSPRGVVVAADLQAALDANPAARSFFETLDKTNRYAILWRIQTVKKAETRARKITHFIGMLERKERIHE